MRNTLSILVLILLTMPAFAVGKVTVDPNAAGAAREEPLQATDTRLTRKVTLSAVERPVSFILDELTKSTGVVFKSGRNNGDWQVRDRKMHIFVKDVPLVDVMNSISRVMKFKWERSGESDWQYRLYMDRRTLLNAEAQRTRAEEKAAAELAKKRANALAQYGKLGALTPAQTAQLKKDNPLMYIFAQSGLGDSLSSFCREVPAAAEALASGQRLDLTGDLLSPSARASLMRAMRAEIDLESRFNSRSPNTRTIPDDLDPATVKITINERLEADRGGPNAALLLGEVRFRYDKGTLGAPVIDPEGGFAKLIGKILVEAEDEGRPVVEVVKDHMDDITSEMSRVAATETGGEALNEHPADPALEAKVKMEAGTSAIWRAEQELAEQSRLSVVSDSFPNLSDHWAPPFVKGGELKISEALDKIGDTYVYNWDKRGGIIELRDRNWFKKRAAQIPDAWLEAWRQELTKTGTLDIGSLAQMAQLTQDQVNANIMPDRMLGQCASVIQIDREMLRFYSTLSADQRAAMLTESGLDLAWLSDDQWTQADKLMHAKYAAGSRDSGSQLVISCNRYSKGTGLVYSFTIMADGTGVAHWSWTGPQYTAPSPDPKKPAKPADAKPSDPGRNAQPPK